MEESEIRTILSDIEKKLLSTWNHNPDDYNDEPDYDLLQKFINGEYNSRLRAKLDEQGVKLDLSPNIQTIIDITRDTFVLTHLRRMGKKD